MVYLSPWHLPMEKMWTMTNIPNVCNHILWPTIVDTACLVCVWIFSPLITKYLGLQMQDILQCIGSNLLQKWQCDHEWPTLSHHLFHLHHLVVQNVQNVVGGDIKLSPVMKKVFVIDVILLPSLLEHTLKCIYELQIPLKAFTVHQIWLNLKEEYNTAIPLKSMD